VLCPDGAQEPNCPRFPACVAVNSGDPVKRFNFGLVGGLADQAIVSLGNFALNILLARALPAAEYGVFSVALSFLVFFNSLHQALVAYPLSVRAAAAPPGESPRLLAVAALLTPLFALAWAAPLGAGLASIGRPALLPAALLALLLWQWQETVRRGFLARSRFGFAIASDLARYGLPAAAVLLAGQLPIGAVMLLIAGSAAAAVLPVLPRLAPHLGPAARVLRPELAGHWRVAAPVLGANLLSALSVQWFLWLLAWRDDPGGAAALVALANIVAIANPVMLGAENMLVPEVARLRASLSFGGMMRLLARRGVLYGAMVAPFFLLILVLPETAARLFYGQASPYADASGLLRLLVGAYAGQLAGTLFSAVLRGYQASGAVFRMQLYPALFGLTAGSWLTWTLGLEGACLSALLAGGLRAAAGLVFVLRLRDAGLPAGAVTVS